MLLALISLLGTAQAGFREDLAPALGVGGSGGIACGSVTRATGALKQLATQAGSFSGEHEKDLAGMLGFLSTDPEKGAFQEDGRFAMVFGAGGTYAITVHTTLPLPTVAARMVTEPGESIIAEGDTYVLRRTAADGTVGPEDVVSAVPGGVGITRGALLEPGPVADPVLAALPDGGEGCAVVVGFPLGGNPAMAKLAGAQLGLYIPLDSAQSARFALSLPTSTPTPDLVLAGPPADVRTPVAPDAWATVGFSFADMDTSALPEDRAAKIKKAQRYLPLAGGITIGGFMPDMAIGVYAPLARPWSAKKTMAHVRTALARQDQAPFTVIDPLHVEVTFQQKTYVVTARQGAIVAGTTPELAAALALNVGTPWLTAADRARAAGWLLAVQARTLPAATGITPPDPLWLAMRLDHGLLVGELALPLGEEGWATVWRTFGAMAGKRKPAEAPAM